MLTNWVEIAGYRHEKIHTGVLKHLLDDPARGPVLATSLLGEPVDAIRECRTEARLPDHVGVADLRALVQLSAGGVSWVAVETKVDSNAFRGQLAHSATPPTRGALLTVGTAAFRLAQRDMTESESAWRVVDVGSWEAALTPLGLGDDPVLAVYLGEVHRETAEHADACRLAWSGDRPPPRVPNARRDTGYLEDFAWLSEVRRLLPAPSDWVTKTEQSGPLMGLFPEEWERRGQVYLEFMCERGKRGATRSLCVKTGFGPANVQRLRDQLADVGTSCGMRPGRRPKATDGSCTCAKLDLTEAMPDVVPPIVQTIHNELAERAPALVA